MRRLLAVPMLLLLLLSACGADQSTAQTPVRFRTDLSAAQGCQYTLSLRGDYGDYVRDFGLACSYTPQAAEFTVVEPEEAAGITAQVSGDGAKVSYDATVLAVEQFESRRISPMAAPWLLGQAWQRGYITSVEEQDHAETVYYSLGYGGNTLRITTTFSEGMPVQGGISDGEKVLISCTISEFSLGKKEADQNEDVETDLGGDQPGRSGT